MRAELPSIFIGGSSPTRKRVCPTLTSSDTAELRKNCVSVRGIVCSFPFTPSFFARPAHYRQVLPLNVPLDRAQVLYWALRRGARVSPVLRWAVARVVRLRET